eukprot:CAMPEP_0204633968 /NCGR_PEP_ID=MMETSP0717-20131115/28189_1 /ASSEMBLY_ACC=CAM_ASM_000666 /TAXON_ID=230516 /ORGANISM="Chaetoceros curvisetus" /LENGTH=142 /DNA_ID=CAMNT_0051652261 /DNA_START=60 /DNA_END=488 /DNA_ORIENTATION=-
MAHLSNQQHIYTVNVPSLSSSYDENDSLADNSRVYAHGNYLPQLATSHCSTSSESSQPISCPIMSYEHHEEMVIHEQEKTYYNSRTWHMYRRIVDARRNNTNSTLITNGKPLLSCESSYGSSTSPKLTEDDLSQDEIFLLEL